MKMASRISCFVLLCAVYGPPAIASPTSDEFLHCHQLASKMLLTCLDETPGYSSNACWSKSRAANDSCYARVFDQHRKPDSKQHEAKKKAEEARRLEMERHEAQKTK